MTIIAIIQARMSSKRLPGKVLKTLGEKTALEYIYHAATKITGVNTVVVATSKQSDDDQIAQWCKEQGAECFRGDLDDVLGRFYATAKKYNAQTIIRLTADCPFLDPQVTGEVLALFEQSKVDYCSNISPPTWPDGLDCEVLSFAALERCYKEAKEKPDREHVTRYIRHNTSLFTVKNLPCPIPYIHEYRWTLDQQEDFDFLNQLALALPDSPSYLEILNILKTNTVLKQKNDALSQKRVLSKTVKTRQFSKSAAILKRAEKTIPLGSQTFSKSKTNYTPGHAPLFASHGIGGRIWDVDGNDYVDMVMGLLPTMLGYCDPDVDLAIREQLDKGITLSLATELEYQLSERIIKTVPCAEKVRFGKNGTDATSAAIRLARAYTGREQIIVCGYHGWQDWYIGSTTRHKGVPNAVRELTHKVNYNDLCVVEDLLNHQKGEIAALIMEPMNSTAPNDGYLESLKSLLHSHGALLIFDEVITGFRFSKGGAQEYFDIMPDLAAFGKGMANGMPLSAITGQADIMNEMDNIFFSSTFGGETLSLAASIAVLDKLDREPVIETLWSRGTQIKERLDVLLSQFALGDKISLAGLAPWSLLQFQPINDIPAITIKTFITHELFKQGVLTLGSHNMCYAHSQDDIDTVINGYEYVLEKLNTYLKHGTLLEKNGIPSHPTCF